MSIRIMAAVWELPHLTATQKIVLLSLADQANDDGYCWPSAATTARRTGLNERSTRRTIGELEAAGVLSRHFAPGKATHYQIHPCHKVTPDTAAPLTQRPRPLTENTATPDTKYNITIKKHKEPQTLFADAIAPADGMVALPVDFLPDGNGGLVVAYRGDDQRAQPKKPNKGHRLPDDWILPMAAGEWALSEGLTREQVLREAERFKDYWHSKPGREGTKTDWAATWRNWIRKAADDLAKHGKRNQGGASMFTELHTDRSWADGLSFIEKHTDPTWRTGL